MGRTSLELDCIELSLSGCKLTLHHLTPPCAHGVILMVATRNLERANSERAGMMTANEAADQLGVKLGTLYAYVSRGWLKSYRRKVRSEEHTSELQSHLNLVCRLLLEKKKQ